MDRDRVPYAEEAVARVTRDWPNAEAPQPQCDN